VPSTNAAFATAFASTTFPFAASPMELRKRKWRSNRVHNELVDDEHF
jgi:hypothetical protein